MLVLVDGSQVFVGPSAIEGFCPPPTHLPELAEARLRWESKPGGPKGAGGVVAGVLVGSVVVVGTTMVVAFAHLWG